MTIISAALLLCTMVRIAPERMPDLNIPRTGHSTFYANGELTVVGGHTTDFVPTQTAEYFAEGHWHKMPMAYCHDNGFAVTLRTGEVIIGGGHSEPLGIGQTFLFERYTPETHTFEGFGCLDRRRVLASGIEMEDGRVIIAGNHYAADAIGCYDGRSQVQHVKDVAHGHSNPYILRTAKDNAIILGGNDIYDVAPNRAWAEQVRGDPIPLPQEWRLVYFDQPFNSDACSVGKYSYLLTATLLPFLNGEEPGTEQPQLAIVLVNDTCFSLLPTSCPIPMRSPFGPIFYKGPVVTDKSHERGYVLGIDSLGIRQYLLAVDYAKRPAQLTLYYTDTLEQATVTIPVVTPEGDVILAGGITNSNFKPFSAVWCYRLGQAETAALPETDEDDRAPWGTTASIRVLLAVIGIAAVAHITYYLLRRKRRNEPPSVLTLEQICEVIEQDNRYLKSLRMSDIAAELGVSVATIAECISNSRGGTFAQLLAEYRVRHAQKLIADNPELKLAVVITESGFTSESTFFRTFKAVTGKTPKEWLADIKLKN